MSMEDTPITESIRDPIQQAGNLSQHAISRPTNASSVVANPCVASAMQGGVCDGVRGDSASVERQHPRPSGGLRGGGGGAVCFVAPLPPAPGSWCAAFLLLCCLRPLRLAFRPESSAAQYAAAPSLRCPVPVATG